MTACARPLSPPANLTSQLWNTSETYVKNDEYLSSQRQSAFFRLARKATFTGGVEMSTTDEDIPSIQADLTARELRGVWSDHPSHRYGVMVAFKPEKVGRDLATHVFDIDPGMIMGARVRSRQQHEQDVFTDEKVPFRPQAWERFRAEPPKRQFSVFTIYVYLKCHNAKDQNAAKQQEAQTLRLNECLKTLESHHPQATFLLQGDWNLALNKPDTLHVSLTDNAMLPKRSLHKNANIFNTSIVPRYVEVFQPVDTLHGKPVQHVGRNDRTYCKICPGLQFVCELHALLKKHRWSTKKDGTRVKLSDHKPIFTRLQKPPSILKP